MIGSPASSQKSMGYSVRTAKVRYTEWRDWATKEVSARELYLTEEDPAELKNVAGDKRYADSESEAERLLSVQFPHGR
jgi:iduronate 2-sulfatase